MRLASTRPQRMENHIDIMTLAPADRGVGRQVAAKDRRQRPVVRQVEISDSCNRNIDVDRIEPLAEYPRCDAAAQDIGDQPYKRTVQIANFLGFAQMARAMQVFAIDEADHLGMRARIVEIELDEPPDRHFRGKMIEMER